MPLISTNTASLPTVAFSRLFVKILHKLKKNIQTEF